MSKSVTSTSGDDWIDPDDAPDWTPEIFDLAEVREGKDILQPAKANLGRGRPKLNNPKQRVTLRLDADLLAKLREEGPGWQTTANVLLRKATGL